MAGDPALAATLRQLRANGTPLLIKGRPVGAAGARGAGLLRPRHRRAPASERRTMARRRGRPARRWRRCRPACAATADADAAFQPRCQRRHRLAVRRPAAGGRRPRPAQASDVQVVLELIQGVEREDPVPRLEAVLKRDPTLAFKLMRYLNSPAFGLRGGDQLLRPRADAAGLPAAQALAGAAAGELEPFAQRPADDLRRGAPRPADGGAGARPRRRRRCAARCSSAACSRCSTA